MTNSEATIANARKAIRLNTRINASIRLENTDLCDCVIKDVSETGMLLFVPRIAWLPANFVVISHVFQEPVPVKKVWSCGENVGVKIAVKNK